MKSFKSETDFTKWFCECIEKIGGFCFALVGGVRQRSGLPDRYISHTRWQGFIEFKKDGNKVKKGGLQDITLRKLRKTGTPACIVTYDKRKERVVFETNHECGSWVIYVSSVDVDGKTDVECARLFLDKLVALTGDAIVFDNQTKY